MKTNGQPCVLIVKFGAIGDVVMVIPAAYALHQAGYAIDWVCGAQVLPILQLYPWIHPIVANDRAIQMGSAIEKMKALAAMWRRVAGHRYDLAATLYYDRRYRLLTAPVRAKRKLMLSHTDRCFNLLPGRHHTDEYARILLDWSDEVRSRPLAPVPAANLPPSPLPCVPGRPRVVMVPAGARNLMRDDALRRWPPEFYASLAQSLLAQDVEVVLTGGPDDHWIRPFFQSVDVIDRIGADSLPATLALLDEADVMVTHDTGPLHLAGMTRVGIVTLFGPTDPRGRLPQRPGALAIWGGEGFACRPCYDGRNFAACPVNECMRQVSPEMTLREIMTMLEDRRRGHLASPRILTPPSTVPAAVMAITSGQIGPA